MALSATHARLLANLDGIVVNFVIIFRIKLLLLLLKLRYLLHLLHLLFTEDLLTEARSVGD